MKNEKKIVQTLKWAIAHLSIRLSAQARALALEKRARGTGGAGERHSAGGAATRQLRTVTRSRGPATTRPDPPTTRPRAQGLCTLVGPDWVLGAPDSL